MAEFSKYLFLFFFLFALSGVITELEANQLPMDSLLAKIKLKLWVNPKLANELTLEYDQRAQAQDDNLLKAKGKNFLGMIQYISGNIDEAIELYLNAMKYAQAAQDDRYTAIIYNNIGAAYQHIDRIEETLTYFTRALETFVELDDTLWIANINNNLGVIFYGKENSTEALEHFLAALDSYKKLGDQENINTLHVNISSSYLEKNNLKKSKEFLQYYLDADYKKNDLYAISLNIRGRILSEEGNHKEALKFFEQAIAFGKENNIFTPTLEGLRHRYGALKKLNRFEDALLAHEKFVAVSDSIFNQEKVENINEMLQKYEAAEKEREINELKLQEEISETELAGSKRLLYFLSGSILILGLFLAKQIQLRRQIKKSSEDKTVLLKEIHHRVKNNLQVISALLTLQSQYVKDENAINALKQGQSRVESMALIHKNLYQHDDLKGVDAQDYFERLGNHLISSYKLSDQNITLNLDIDDISIDVDTMIPLGLVINELISNSIKHAFKKDVAGKIDIRLKRQKKELFLRVEDNGLGLKNDNNGKSSFGQSLIRSLTRRLNASIKTSSVNGYSVELIIPNFQNVNS